MSPHTAGAAAATQGRLGDEPERYLAVVEAFRAEGHEPHWRPEPSSLPPRYLPVRGLLRPLERRELC